MTDQSDGAFGGTGAGEALLALAERCEKAEGPDRELDAAIAPLTGLTVVDEGHPIGRMCYDDIGAAHLMPRYTASLDAAMTLVPESWGWMVSQPNAKALSSGLLKERTPVMGEVQYGCDQRYAVAAATPALALCAAALRARAAIALATGAAA
jgi:hypothetical protein